MTDPVAPTKPDKRPAISKAAPDPTVRLTYNAKLGLILFGVYTSLYGSFVVISAFYVEWMGVLWKGVPASVWSGFGLILFAVVLAILYGVLARDEIEVGSEMSELGSDQGG